MTVPLLTLTHMDTGVRYGHKSDKRAFFEWLKRISCVKATRAMVKTVWLSD
jgi:hypothetical protein